MEIAIDTIIIGDGRREDLGDVAGLAASIQEHGLLQPVVIDAENRLVAGMRRLAACRLLGWLTIEVRQYGELTDQELHFLEIEENNQRKDLTAYEMSKEMVSHAEAVGGQPTDGSEFSSQEDLIPGNRALDIEDFLRSEARKVLQRLDAGGLPLAGPSPEKASDGNDQVWKLRTLWRIEDYEFNISERLARIHEDYRVISGLNFECWERYKYDIPIPSLEGNRPPDGPNDSAGPNLDPPGRHDD